MLTARGNGFLVGPRGRLLPREPGRAGQSCPHRRWCACAELEGWTCHYEGLLVTVQPF